MSSAVKSNKTKNVHTRKLRDSPRIRRPGTPQPSLLELRARICSPQPFAFPLARRLLVHEMRSWDGMAGVVACCISVPEVDEDIWKGLTCLDVNYAYVEELG